MGSLFSGEYLLPAAHRAAKVKNTLVLATDVFPKTFNVEFFKILMVFSERRKIFDRNFEKLGLYFFTVVSCFFMKLLNRAVSETLIKTGNISVVIHRTEIWNNRSRYMTL